MGKILFNNNNEIKEIIGAYIVINDEIKKIFLKCVINDHIEDFIQYVEQNNTNN